MVVFGYYELVIGFPKGESNLGKKDYGSYEFFKDDETSTPECILGGSRYFDVDLYEIYEVTFR
jgi:hypothetical protein